MRPTTSRNDSNSVAIFRQVTFRVLIGLASACALAPADPACGQTTAGSFEPESLDIPFSWATDPPQPVAGIQLPPVRLPQKQTGEETPGLESSFTPAMIENESGETTAAAGFTLPVSSASPNVAAPQVIPIATTEAFPGQVNPGPVETLGEMILESVPVAPSPSATVPSATATPAATDIRPKILFQPAVPVWDPASGTILKPTVHLAADPTTEILPTPDDAIAEIIPATPIEGEGRVVIPDTFETDQVWVSPRLGERFNQFRQRPKPIARTFRAARNLLRSRYGSDLGIGIERLPFALFEIDAAQPSNNFRIRMESARDWEFPDRVEYFWGKLNGKGPKVDSESSVDYQDYRIAIETGGERFSATTEIPLRFIDPTGVANTGGMGDMVVTTKTVMMDGESFQLTQVLRNQMPTGSVKRGLGNGHVSMEPGFVARYNWDQRTMIHNELKLWFPIGAEPGFSGPVLRYGFGCANVWYDSDTFAVLRSFEMVGWSILTGQKTVGTQFPPVANPQSIDGENIINLYPGLRFVRDDDGTLFEVGVSGGVSVTERHWYSDVLRLELRWTF